MKYWYLWMLAGAAAAYAIEFIRVFIRDRREWKKYSRRG